MSYKICFTGSHMKEIVKQRMNEHMREKGYCLDQLEMKTRNAEEWMEDLKDYDVIISCGEKYNRNAFKYLSSGKLKLVSRFGIGYDEIDVAAATESGVAFCNAAGTLTSPVAETALLLAMGVLRRLHDHNTEVKAGRWGNIYTGNQLEGKTVGLIGFGAISRKLARYLTGFSCEMLAFDKFFNEEAARELGVKKSSLEEITVKSDIISIHVPATAETRGMIDAKFFSMMKPTAVLVNTARGAIVNEKDLITALQNGVISGAGLDVFEKEPVEKYNPLLKMDNVMVTPHIAAHTIEGITESAIRACDNAIAFLESRKVPTLVNPDYIKNVK